MAERFGVLGVAAVVALALALQAQADPIGSGVAATAVRHVPAFHAVSLTAANDVRIHVGAHRRVVVHGDANLLPLVTTSVAGGRLLIGASQGFKTTRSMHVDVTVPTLDAVTIAAGASGVVRASGSAARLDATLAGFGSLELASLVVRDAHARLSGSGRIALTATHSVTALLSGSGAIVYGGRPALVTKHITGLGSVTAK